MQTYGEFMQKDLHNRYHRIPNPNCKFCKVPEKKKTNTPKLKHVTAKKHTKKAGKPWAWGPDGPIN